MYVAASRSVTSGFRPGTAIGSTNRLSQDTNLHLPLIGGATREYGTGSKHFSKILTSLDSVIMRGSTLRCVMDGVSWTDLDPDEQRAIALLGAGVSVELCDRVALLTLARLGLVRGEQLTPAADQLRRAAILHELAA
jgi:hypothetical protein